LPDRLPMTRAGERSCPVGDAATAREAFVAERNSVRAVSRAPRSDPDAAVPALPASRSTDPRYRCAQETIL